MDGWIDRQRGKQADMKGKERNKNRRGLRQIKRKES
jgi:hypothetical protein